MLQDKMTEDLILTTFCCNCSNIHYSKDIKCDFQQMLNSRNAAAYISDVKQNYHGNPKSGSRCKL